ncbi:hypothetical protein [Streptomyces sp. NPDC051219]|uniref:hypothetical protein n=1 Tax=Streptomyces sp. NPDC051219 TaxID=3155283 RepID=UPI00342BD0FA
MNTFYPRVVIRFWLLPLLAATVMLGSGCAASTGKDEGSELRDVQIVGTWANAEGISVSFSSGGAFSSASASCGYFFAGEAEETKELEGEWDLRTPPLGGAREVSVTFPPGDCSEGPSIGSFSVHRVKGEIVLYVGDVDYLEPRRLLHKEN